MKVLMLGWEFPPHISGGLGTACHGLTLGLAQHGVHVLFVVPRLYGGEPTGTIGEGSVELMPAIGQPPEPVPVDSALLPYLGAQAYEARARDLPDHYGGDIRTEVGRYAVAVAERAAGIEFDVIHAHDWMTFAAGIAVRERTGKPLIVHVHSCEYDRAGEAADPSIVAAEQAGFAVADRIVCVSQFTADALRHRYGVSEQKLRVVHNATLHAHAPATPREERGISEPVVLFLGRVTQQKGPEYFLEAAARVAVVDPTVQFVVAGTGDMLPGMIERAAELSLAQRVHFTGFLQGDDVLRMYQQADVYVMPSVSEPFGISPLEAMASDVPVIVSRQSGVREVLPSALQVDFWDTEDLANKILSVLHRPALRDALTAAGREELGQLTWKQQAGLVRDVYSELIW